MSQTLRALEEVVKNADKWAEWDDLAADIVDAAEHLEDGVRSHESVEREVREMKMLSGEFPEEVEAWEVESEMQQRIANVIERALRLAGALGYTLDDIALGLG